MHTVLIAPKPAPSITPNRLHRRVIQCDPLPRPSTVSTGWGWRCKSCHASDDGFATGAAASEAMEHHERTQHPG